MAEFLALLEEQFDPHKAAELDITVAFECAGEQYRIHIDHGQATFYPPDDNSAPKPELVLYFTDESTARGILGGQISPIDAFMASDFRSNGYIIWTFQTLAAFSKVH